MASVTYGKSIRASVIMAKVLWQMKLSRFLDTLIVAEEEEEIREGEDQEDEESL